MAIKPVGIPVLCTRELSIGRVLGLRALITATIELAESNQLVFSCSRFPLCRYVHPYELGSTPMIQTPQLFLIPGRICLSSSAITKVFHVITV